MVKESRIENGCSCQPSVTQISECVIRTIEWIDRSPRLDREGGNPSEELIAVGTRALEVAEEGPAALAAYVASLREALDAT